MHRLRLHFELFVERIREAGQHRALGETEAAGSLRRQRGGHRLHRRHQLRFRGHVPDQSPLLRLHGRHLLGQKEHTRCALRPHEARHEEGATRVGDEAEFGEALHEADVVGRDREIASEGQIRAGTRGDTVYGAQHWLLDGANGAEDWVVVAPHDLTDIRHRSVALRQRFGQILAGAETATGPSQHDRAHRRIARGGIERREQRGRHLPIEAVEHVGTVQR